MLPFVTPNATIVFYPDSEDYLTFASFTPEGYGEINLLDEKGAAFVSYYEGIPHLHPVIADKWNNFYGTTCDMVATISFNKFPEKQKHFIAMEVQSDVMWYVVDVNTDDISYISEIPPVRFKRVANRWNAGFLGNINSRNGLYNGQLPSGYWAEVTLVRDQSVSNQYNSIDNGKREAFSELDMVVY